VHAVAEMEDIGGVVRRFPAFGEIRLDEEGARWNPGPDPIPHELAVDKAQCGMGSDIEREMRVKVLRISAGDTEGAAAFRLPCFRSPKCRCTMERPRGQCHAGGEASVQQRATGHIVAMWGTGLRCVHRSSSVLRLVGRAA
jgi:hypothetical protein